MMIMALNFFGGVVLDLGGVRKGGGVLFGVGGSIVVSVVYPCPSSLAPLPPVV